MNPNELENVAKDIVKNSELELTILNVKEMEDLGMEVILGVGQGSKNNPKMIIINYKGDKENQNNNIAVIGKGITFDSGGLNLKPGMSMRTMKTDMSGSAIVLGVMKAIAYQKPKKNVMGILAIAENMPGGNAQRPGDVVRAMNGKTIEIGNTDAEGRLVLSDALSYAVDKGVNNIIDIASALKYTISFSNALYHPHTGHLASTLGTTAGGILSSTGFTITGDSNTYYLEDDGAGLVTAYYISGSTKVYLATGSIGTIDYTTGDIVLTKVSFATVGQVDGIDSTAIRITVQPASNDVVPVRNQILQIDTVNLSVTGSADTIASGSSDAGVNYVTTASY